MARADRSSGRAGRRGLSVALTGATGKLGAALLARLLQSREVYSVVALDAQAPAATHAKLHFAPLDLTATSADRTIAEALADHRVEAFAHLPLASQPADPAYAHEVEAMGTLRVLAGLGPSPVKRVVVASTTSVYGASPQNPNHLDESRPLMTRSRSRYLRDKVEMEKQVQSFRDAHPDRAVTVLRFPPIVGPGVYDPFASFLERRFAATVCGYDPLIQLIHVDDALGALERAIFSAWPGQYNVGSRGLLPLSAVLEGAGVRSVPLPFVATPLAVKLTNTLGLTRTPPALIDFVRYLCVADLRKADRAGFAAQRTIHEALEAFAEHRQGRS